MRDSAERHLALDGIPLVHVDDAQADDCAYFRMFHTQEAAFRLPDGTVAYRLDRNMPSDDHRWRLGFDQRQEHAGILLVS